LVRDDAEEPGPQARAFAQVADPLPRGESRFLHGVLGFVDILEQATGKPKRRPVLRPEEIGESRRIAGSGRLDEVGLGLPEQHSLDYLCNQ
jgi:hypothetical protein